MVMSVMKRKGKASFEQNEIFELVNAKVSDAKEISNLIIDNFNNASSYKHLTEEERKKYIDVNIEGKWLAKLSDDDNFGKIIKNKNGEIIGVRLVKRELINTVNGEVLEVLSGKRIHVKRGYTSRGLGKRLIEETFNVAKENNIDYVTAVPSNEKIKEIFLKAGYVPYSLPDLYKNKGIQPFCFLIKKL